MLLNWMHVTLATIRAVIHSLNAADIQVELEPDFLQFQASNGILFVCCVWACDF